MICYKRCTEVELEKVYLGFTKGFSDYIIKFEISQEEFVKRFLGPEGNALEHSFVALDEDKAVGVILGGIKDYEGIRTMRCGTLCIDPDYRGKGVSQELVRLHKETALANGCKQLFLEVVVGNDRAIKFYNSLGYEKIYDITYYTLMDASYLKAEKEDSFEIKQISYETMHGIDDMIRDIHINWQNDFDFIKKAGEISYYGAYFESELIGALAINKMGKIFMLWTMPSYRLRGIAKSLITKAARELQLKKLTISAPNNANLEGFVKHIGFTKDKISQYEMYLTL